MGAIGGALSDSRQQRSTPLALGSNKSCYGHTEGTAGLTGLLLAACAQHSQQLAPIVNLRDLNPYVSSAVDDWHARHGLAAALPRQPAPMPAAPGAALSGTSSFGMSGVNAHALVSAPASPHHEQPLLPWARQRYWLAPRPHPLLPQCSISAHSTGSTAIFMAGLDSARVAFMRDHRVASKLLVPATAFLELLAAAGVLCGDGLHQLPGLTGVSIQAPKVLGQDPHPGDGMSCTLDLRSGRAEVASADGTVHVAASTVELAAQRAPAAAAEGCCPSAASLRSQHSIPGAADQRPALVNWAEIASCPDAGCWLVHPPAADASLHLSAVKVRGVVDDGGRIPVGVAAVVATPPRGNPHQQWSASELPIVSPDLASATCSMHIHEAGAVKCTVSNVLAKPLPSQRGAKPKAEDAAAAAVEHEHQHFTYAAEWQAVAAALEPQPHQQQQLVVLRHGASLQLVAEGVSAAAAAGDLTAALSPATRLRLRQGRHAQYSKQAANLAPSTFVAQAMEVLQRLHAALGSASTPPVEAIGLAPGRGVAAVGRLPAGAGVQHSMLAALLKVAAAEQPDSEWGSGSVDPCVPPAQRPTLAGDVHGLHVQAGLVMQPLLKRYPM